MPRGPGGGAGLIVWLIATRVSRPTRWIGCRICGSNSAMGSKLRLGRRFESVRGASWVHRRGIYFAYIPFYLLLSPWIGDRSSFLPTFFFGREDEKNVSKK